MYMYLTAKPSGGRLQIPLLPDRLNVRTNAMTITSQIINVGEVKIPRGTSLTGYSWNGELPAEHMKNYPFISAWQAPKNILETLNTWMRTNQLLTFMVTEATINEDVYIETLSYELMGNGNIGYNIALSTRRALTIRTVPAPPAPPPSTGTPSGAKQYGRVQLSNPNGTAPVLSEAQPGARVLGYLRHNEVVEILGTSGNYYRIPYRSGQGFVLKRYITLQPNQATVPPAPPVRPSPPYKPPANTGHPDKNRIPDAAAATTTVKPFETIADIARKVYGSNTLVKTIVDANRPLLQNIANTAKSIIGKVTAGLKLITPSAPPQPQKPAKSDGGGSANNRPTMLIH